MMIGFDAEHPEQLGGRMLVVSGGGWHTLLKRLIGVPLPAARPELQSVLHRGGPGHRRPAAVGGCPDIALGIGPRLMRRDRLRGHRRAPLSEREHLIELTSPRLSAVKRAASTRMTPGRGRTGSSSKRPRVDRAAPPQPAPTWSAPCSKTAGSSTEDVLINCDNVLIGGLTETTRHPDHPASSTPSRRSPAPWTRCTPTRTSPGRPWRRWSAGRPRRRTSCGSPTEDCEIGGQEVLKGQPVVAWLSAANRDERLFPTRTASSRAAPQPPPRVRQQPAPLSRRRSGPSRTPGADTGVGGRARGVELAGEVRWMRSNLVQGYSSLKGLPGLALIRHAFL